jgi:ATP phosphoribosyltransferase
MAFLEKLNIKFPPLVDDDRRLIFDSINQNPSYRILLARATDVPTYVEQGVADIGIVGSDLLAEQMRELYELVDLKFGQCRLVVAEPVHKKKPQGLKPRIATKYPNITEQFFSEKGIPIEIIKLYGSVELAPLVGLADQIVDLTETGKTLKAQGLTIVDEIAHCSARMIVNRAALKLSYPQISNLIEAAKDVVK